MPALDLNLLLCRQLNPSSTKQNHGLWYRKACRIWILQACSYTLCYTVSLYARTKYSIFFIPCTAAIKCAVISLKWFKVSMSNSRICLSMIKVLYQIYHRLIRNHNHKMHKGETHYQETKNSYPISHQR